ncbi:MAG: type II secretion system protein [Peptostreptococcaceae bacterium]
MKDLKKKKRPGFTLVEMVVVVSILGVLAGLGFMKFDQVQVKARENADEIASTNLATAASLYVNDKPNLDGLLPIANETEYKELKLETLKSSNYITAEPTPKSKEGEFIITVKLDTKEVSVKIKEKSNAETKNT